jgi:hypothetical protein
MTNQDAKLGNCFLKTIYNKRFKKIPELWKYQKYFLQEKSNGFVILKTYFAKHYVQNCVGKEKVHFVVKKMHKLVTGNPVYMSYLIFFCLTRKLIKYKIE